MGMGVTVKVRNVSESGAVLALAVALHWADVLTAAGIVNAFPLFLATVLCSLFVFGCLLSFGLLRDRIRLILQHDVKIVSVTRTFLLALHAIPACWAAFVALLDVSIRSAIE